MHIKNIYMQMKSCFLEISGKPGILIEKISGGSGIGANKILGESGKVRDSGLNSSK